MKNLQQNTYKITDNHLVTAKFQNLTPHIIDILTDIHDDVIKGKKKMIPKLIKLALKYPKVPQFKNHLSAVYKKLGNIEKSFETNKWLIAEHPNYLFGKLNLANEYIYKKEFNKVFEVLGENLDIHELYPERKEFHLDEIMSFYVTTIRYFLETGNEEQAQICLDFLKEIDKNHPKIEDAEHFFMTHNYAKMPGFFREQQEKMIEVFVPDRRKNIQTTKKPQFHFPKQMDYLYTNDTTISEKLLQEILSLDKTKLIEDLYTIINDSIVRFDYYFEEVENEGWNEKNYNFITHALLLLSEIKELKNIDPILNIIRQDNDYVDFWFGDIIMETYGYVLYEIAKTHLPKITSFLKEPNLYCYLKSVIIETVLSLSLISDDYHKKVLSFCDDLLSFHIKNSENKDITDTEFLGLFIAEIMDLKNAEILLPKIKILFDLNIVGYWVCGKYNDVEREVIENNSLQENKYKRTLQEKYDILNTFSFVNNDDDIPYFKEEEEEIIPVRTSEKIRRNDPCPCNSGKKYKKCCINK